MGCYKCGSDAGDEAKLCPDCTKKRLEEKSAQNEAFRSKEQFSKPSTPIVLPKMIICGGVVSILALAAAIYFFSIKTTPSAAKVNDIVLKHLTDSYNCKGAITVNSFIIKGIGDFVPQFGGYPVNADYSIQCKQGNSSITYNSSNTPSQPVAAAFVRKTTFGSYEAFTPELFKQASKQLNEEFSNIIGKELR